MSAVPDLADALPRFCDRRNPQGQTPMTLSPQPAPKATKTKRKDAYVARLTVFIPLDMADAETLAKATKAIDAMAGGLPAGSKVDFASRALGKMGA